VEGTAAMIIFARAPGLAALLIFGLAREREKERTLRDEEEEVGPLLLGATAVPSRHGDDPRRALVRSVLDELSKD
jgi:hypothetical protein